MPSVVINPDEWLIEPVWGNDDMGNYVLLNPGVRKPAQDTGSPGPPAPTPSGGSRGYGGYSGGGAPSPAARQSLQDDFIDWFGEGNYSQAALTQATTEAWTSDDVRRYAVSQGAAGPLARAVWDSVRQALRNAGIQDAPASLVRDIIRTGVYEDSTYFNNVYLPSLSGFDVTKSPGFGAFVDYWSEQTGVPITYTAIKWIGDNIRLYGEAGALDLFKQWVPTTDSAITGNYGATHREEIRDLIGSTLHRDATPEELDPKGKLWGLNPSAQMEYLRGTPDYAVQYAGKPGWMDEETYNAVSPAYDDAYRRIYGIQVPGIGDVPGEGAVRSGVYRNGYDAYNEQFYIQGSDGTTTYFGSEAEYQTKLNSYGASLEDPTGMPAWLKAYYLDNHITPGVLLQQSAWMEDADYLKGTLNPQLQEVFGTSFTDEELYILASGAKGSGALRVKALDAQNRLQFREVFRDYTGRDPDVGDYAYLDANFISPNEYARRMGAKEKAAAMAPEVNELFSRVYGHSVSQSELENMAMGGEGSGALQAQINQATRLDSYRWIHKQYYGAEPTAADYAKYAGFAGPEELLHQLSTTEKIAEYKDELQKLWQDVYQTQLSDTQLNTLFGEEKGYGSLRSQWTAAKKKQAEKDAADNAAQTAERGIAAMTSSKQGGIETGFKSMASQE